jgi:hypothetical protein
VRERASSDHERPWTPTEAAAYLSVNVRTLYRLPIPCVIFGARTRRYLPSIIRQFMEDHLNDPTKRTSRVS